MKVNLVNGLIKMIAEVEKLPEHTTFTMENYDNCVIGKTVGWSDGPYTSIQSARTLRRIFGIKRDDEVGLFCGAQGSYTDRTWKVIRLFTDNIGDRVSRDDWLKLAKQTLSELKSA